MKKLGLILVSIFILVGCGGNVPAVNPPVNPPATSSKPFVEPTGIDNKTWISPGLVEIGNFSPGAEAEWTIKVHNGGDSPAIFLVTYRVPDSTRSGFSMPPASTQVWITISDSTPLIAAHTTKDILVNLKMPSSAKNVPAKWEFWVSVKEKTDTMIQTELCSRWAVSMA